MKIFLFTLSLVLFSQNSLLNKVTIEIPPKYSGWVFIFVDKNKTPNKQDSNTISVNSSGFAIIDSITDSRITSVRVIQNNLDITNTQTAFLTDSRFGGDPKLTIKSEENMNQAYFFYVYDSKKSAFIDSIKNDIDAERKFKYAADSLMKRVVDTHNIYPKGWY